MKKYETIFVIDGITNGICKIEKINKKGDNPFVYFNVHTTETPRVRLTQEDTLKLINNVKDKQITFVGIINGDIDEIINENDLNDALTLLND